MKKEFKYNFEIAYIVITKFVNTKHQLSIFNYVHLLPNAVIYIYIGNIIFQSDRTF